MTGIGLIFWVITGFEGNKWQYEQLIKDGFIPENEIGGAQKKKEEVETSSSLKKL